MAIMRKEQRDVDGLGPIGIIREALKLFWAHAKFFLLGQLTLILPLAILLSAVEYYLISNPWLLNLLANHFTVSFHGIDPALLNTQIGLLELTVGTLVFQAAISLSQSITLYSVGLHYAGQPVSFLQALCASTPRLWMRLALTNAYCCVLEWWVLFVYVWLIFLLPVEAPWVPFVVKVWLGFEVAVGWVCLPFIFMVASCVSVLEEDSGWASVRNSLKLLKGKVIVAVLFQLLWLVKVGIEYRCLWALFTSTVGGVHTPWTVMGVIVYLCWTTFFWQFKTLCSGVQYVSFKASHNEILADPIVGGYDRIRDGSQVASFGSEDNLRGQPAHSTVYL